MTETLPGSPLITFLLRETATAVNPNDARDTHLHLHHGELLDTIFALLSDPSKDNSLTRLESKLVNALVVIANSVDLERLNQAIEDIATGFEPFLKLIACIIYKNDPVSLFGDTRYIGIMNMTLGRILVGEVDKVNNKDNTVPKLLSPVVAFSYQERNIREAVYNFTRKLRNEIHSAPLHSRIEVLERFRILFSAYLFAVSENVARLRIHVDPIFRYLLRLKEQCSLWECSYVDLEGEQRAGSLSHPMPDPEVLEWRDPADAYLERVLEIENETVSIPVPPPQRSTVTEIAVQFQRFWLIGEAGAGKSTSLQKLALLGATRILRSGYISQDCPVIVPLRRFDRDHSIYLLLTTILGISQERLASLLQSGSLFLLLDGANEAPRPVHDELTRELSSLLNGHKRTRIAITTRKSGYKQKIPISVFEILPFSDSQILDYLDRHPKTRAKAADLMLQLRSSHGLLLDLARNPMLLSMLADVSDEGSLPNNRGRLFQKFTRWILKREEKNSRLDVLLKENVLADIGFRIRRSGKRFADQSVVLDWLIEICDSLHIDLSADVVFRELLSNRFIHLDSAGTVTFWHELFLEYFATVVLLKEWNYKPDSIAKYLNQIDWQEPIRMLAGLIGSADELISRLCPQNIVLAARCVASGASVSALTLERLVAHAVDLSSSPKNKRQAVTALLEIGTDDSIGRVIKLLVRESDGFPLTEALSDCERPEFATLRLLRKGLTGKHRMFQCLNAIRSDFVSKSMIDSEEVGQAQIALLRAPTTRYLTLLRNLGLNEGIRSLAEEELRSILSRVPVKDSLWQAAIDLARSQGLLGALTAVVRDRILSQTDAGASDCYATLIAFKSLERDAALESLIHQFARLILEKRWYGLACRYIQDLRIKDGDVERAAIDAIDDMASVGRIVPLLEYQTIYPDLAWSTLLERAAKKTLDNQRIDVLQSLGERVRPYLLNHHRTLAKMLIGSYVTGSWTARKMLRYIESFGLQAQFESLGVIVSYRRRKREASLLGLSNRRLVYCKPELVRVHDTNSRLLGKIVYYQATPSEEFPGKFSATQMKVLSVAEAIDCLP